MFSKEIIAAAKEDAIKRYPNESCGVITDDGYTSFENVSKTPTESFECGEEGRKFELTHKVLALVHSHPVASKELFIRQNGPSRADMQQQIVMNIPWGIILTDGVSSAEPFFWGAGVEIPALENRHFRHGPSGSDGRGDCYALIKDWYKVNKNIDLMEMPRDDMWWTESVGQNLYVDNIQNGGFHPVDRSNPKIGDVVLGQVVSKNGIPNHGGIYIGNGMLFHHLPGRYSRIEPIGNWMKFITHWLRHNDTTD